MNIGRTDRKKELQQQCRYYRSTIYISDDFCILNMIINKVGSKKTSLEIDRSIDAFPSMTRYQPVYTIAAIYGKP